MGDFEAERGGGWNVDVVGAGALKWMLVLCAGAFAVHSSWKMVHGGGEGKEVTAGNGHTLKAMNSMPLLFKVFKT